MMIMKAKSLILNGPLMKGLIQNQVKETTTAWRVLLKLKTLQWMIFNNQIIKEKIKNNKFQKNRVTNVQKNNIKEVCTRRCIDKKRKKRWRFWRNRIHFWRKKLMSCSSVYVKKRCKLADWNLPHLNNTTSNSWTCK